MPREDEGVTTGYRGILSGEWGAAAHLDLITSDFPIQTSSWALPHPPTTNLPPCRNRPTDREPFPSGDFEIGQLSGSDAVDQELPGYQHPPSPARSVVLLHLPWPRQIWLHSQRVVLMLPKVYSVPCTLCRAFAVSLARLNCK